MRLCRYGTAPDVGKTSTDMPLEMPGTGQLRDGRDLSVADGRAILAEAGNGASALPCLQRATLFVALYPLIAHQPTAQPIVVEVDGCQRLASGDDVRSASEGVLSLIRELDE